MPKLVEVFTAMSDKAKKANKLVDKVLQEARSRQQGSQPSPSSNNGVTRFEFESSGIKFSATVKEESRNASPDRNVLEGEFSGTLAGVVYSGKFEYTDSLTIEEFKTEPPIEGDKLYELESDIIYAIDDHPTICDLVNSL